MRYSLPLLAAACLAAAPAPQCLTPGQVPVLNGDPFTPVECSSAPASALPLPDEPAGVPLKPDLKAVSGSWEGSLVRGIGRYAATITVSTGWRGKIEVTLRWKEQQFRQTGEARLVLTPEKTPGHYNAVMTSSLLPQARLAGTARFTVEPRDGAPPRARVDLSFPNGAAHRLRWELASKDALRLAAVWAVPAAPLQTVESELRRAKS